LAQLAGSDAAVRHVIAMTDGLTEPGDFSAILSTMADARITVSTVAIGSGADTEILDAIARLGRGAFHASTDFAALPSILSQEALLLSGTPIEERRAAPEWEDHSSDFLRDFPDRMPDIDGYVLTTLQAGASVHLSVSGEDEEPFPLLASWRYGNGRVAAFASHGAGAWTARWAEQPDYPRFWAQILRHFLPLSAAGDTIEVSLTRQGDAIHVAARGKEELGAELVLEAFHSAPNASRMRIAASPAALPVSLRRTSHGSLQGELSGAVPGDYRVTLQSGDQLAEALLYVPFPASEDYTRADPDRIAALATMTGGRVLGRGETPFPAAARRFEWRAGTPFWVLLTLLLFAFHLLLRYVPEWLGAAANLLRFRPRPAPA
jgi:hypothetical protein